MHERKRNSKILWQKQLIIIMKNVERASASHYWQREGWTCKTFKTWLSTWILGVRNFSCENNGSLSLVYSFLIYFVDFSQSSKISIDLLGKWDCSNIRRTISGFILSSILYRKAESAYRPMANCMTASIMLNVWWE